MDDATKALLVRSLTFIDVAVALTQQEGQALRAQIVAQLNAAQPRPENGQDTAVPV